MLQVTADVFSGRRNPAWIITDEQEARMTLKELAKEPKLTWIMHARSFCAEGLTD
jgi:hypothetical protein